MSRRKSSWTESISDLLESWGITPRVAASARQLATIHVFGPTGAGAPVLVGTLLNEAGEYVFRYDADYAAHPEYPAITAFPEKQREYRSPNLWPFFDVRLPPLRRADVQHVIRERGIDEHDVLRLLGELGAKAVTTPYELRYNAA